MWEFAERASNTVAPLMERSHRLPSGIARAARWGLPWIAILALSASIASAMTFALAGAPAHEPETTGPPAPSAVTAALADGDDVRARFLAGLTLRDGGPMQHDPAASSDACETSDGRLLYVGLNSRIVAQPEVTPCGEGGS
jgi:hypothetical protein